jgi:LPXTG-motif cell wall-anchored protein
MKHLAPLVAVYMLTAALVLPGTLFAQESAEPAPPEPAPASEPAPAPAPAAPAPAEPPPSEAAPPPPEPQVLADEREEAPKPKPLALAAASGSVTIVDFDFNPGTITINQGDTVTWVNNGPTPHSATSSNGAFDTGIFPAGQSRSHTFNEAGTFAYICTPHPNMRGTVVVQGAQTDGGQETTDSGSGATDTGTTGEAAQSDGGPALPNSGADSGALFVLGGLLLLLGAAVHRRVHPE